MLPLRCLAALAATVPSLAFQPALSTAARRRALSSRAHAFDAKNMALFPGQGAQYVGMGAEIAEELPAAKALFDTASEILGYDLLATCAGPKEKLDTTAVSQPAIFVASMAAVEKLRSEAGGAAVDGITAAMGLSLGEYSALCFAGALSFEDGVRITKVRGEAMQAAADLVDSSMVSVIGLDEAKCTALCEAASADSKGSVRMANLLCKGNYAVSGDTDACAKLMEIAKPDFGARMTIKLAVAGAFHTDLMAPAVGALEAALEAADISAPRIPVISNVNALPHTDPAAIKAQLAKQVTAPVLWEKSFLSAIASGYELGYELGPGKVIAGIAKRIDKTAVVEAVSV